MTDGLAVPAGVPEGSVHLVVPGVLDKALDSVTPQGVAAVAYRPTTPIEATWARAAMVLVLVEVGDPGNVGTIIRSAEAAGLAGVVVTAGSADPYGPKAVRASAGSVFRVPVASELAVDDVVDACHTDHIPTLGSVMSGGVSHLGLDLDGRVAVFLGNEAHGLAPDLLARLGPTESLNVAMCATVVAFEGFRQHSGRARPAG